MKAEKIGYSKDPLSVHYMQEIKRLFDPKGLLNPYKVRKPVLTPVFAESVIDRSEPDSPFPQ